MEYFSKDDKVFNNGRRNADGVDFSIACHVLGISEAEEIKDKLLEISETMRHLESTGFASWIEARKKIETVSNYLGEWGPAGHEKQALTYCIRSEAWYDEKLKMFELKRKEKDEQTA